MLGLYFLLQSGFGLGIPASSERTCPGRSPWRARAVLACPNCLAWVRSCALCWWPGFLDWAPPCIHARPPRLSGLAPFNRDSGRWRGQRRIRGGRADMRWVLYVATLATVCAGSPLSHTYARLNAAGNPPRSPSWHACDLPPPSVPVITDKALGRRLLRRWFVVYGSWRRTVPAGCDHNCYAA
ncbi:transposase [Xanthomonas translucens]|uniref:transposase n=1 Tax=Xanthomonas campestris pv. translucens TaxID=343 RepID=UPI003CE489EC